MAIVAGEGAQTASSWRRPEANPVLANSGGNFGTQSGALNPGLPGTSLSIEHWALRHNSRLCGPLAWINLPIAGGVGGVAMYKAHPARPAVLLRGPALREHGQQADEGDERE